jgi:hypothetical protein
MVAMWVVGSQVAHANSLVESVLTGILLIPGIVVLIPLILRDGHNAWIGYFVIGAILNWLFYTQCIYWILKRRRLKSEAAIARCHDN